VPIFRKRNIWLSIAKATNFRKGIKMFLLPSLSNYLVLKRKPFKFKVSSKKASRTMLAYFFLSDSEKLKKWEFTFRK